MLNGSHTLSLAMVDDTAVSAKTAENSKVRVDAFECESRVTFTTEIYCHQSCVRTEYIVRKEVP